MALSPHDMNAAIERNLLSRTGKDLAAWVALARTRAGDDRRALIAWLKASHGLGHVTAQLVATRALVGSAPTARALLHQRFDERARALLEVVEPVVLGVSPDVERVVCKTYVGYRRKKQFAAIRPHRDGLEVAVALRGASFGLSPTRFKGGGGLTHGLVVDRVTPALLRAVKAAAGGAE
ncbi:MAG: DUF4287 domain-containing protein [Myxococcaceae bacterium]|jgi:hypothetical protein|nr:DUF4287 domain-containing protein [Myxococcaceae bacterium]